MFNCKHKDFLNRGSESRFQLASWISTLIGKEPKPLICLLTQLKSEN